MNCPRDNATLVLKKKGNMSIYLCETCGGFLVPLSDTHAKQLENLLKHQISKAPDNFELNSPQSNSKMKQFSYRSVQLDYCEDSHSIWFDRGEYSKIFAPVAPSSKHSKTSSSKDQTTAEDIIFSPIETVTSTVDIIEISGDVIKGVGDFVGDMFSSLDIF